MKHSLLTRRASPGKKGGYRVIGLILHKVVQFCSSALNHLADRAVEDLTAGVSPLHCEGNLQLVDNLVTRVECHDVGHRDVGQSNCHAHLITRPAI